MRLETCRIRNLGPFRDFAVDLRTLPGPLVALVGPNGAGKSTFAELFAPGAFYRQTPTRGSLVDLATARDALLEVTAVNGHAYTFRHLVDKVSGKGEALVLDEHGAPVLPDTKLKSFDAWAVKHLPAPEVLYSCMFAPQGSGGFLAAKPAERKATLLRVLGVEHLEALSKAAREHVGEASRAHHLAMQRLADEQTRVGDLAALEAALGQAKTAVVSADEAVIKARAELEAGRAERARIDELKRENERRQAKRLELEAALAKSRGELADVEQRLANNRAVLADAAAIRAGMADAERLTAELAAARAAAEKAEAAVRTHADQALELDQRLHALAARFERAGEALAARDVIAKAEASLPALEAAVAEAEGAVGVAEVALEDLQGQRVAGVEERITPLRKALDDIRDCEDGADDPRARLADVASLARTTVQEDDAALKLAEELPGLVAQASAALRAARDRKALAERALADARAVADRRHLLEAAEQDQAAAAAEQQALSGRRDEARSLERLALQAAQMQRWIVAKVVPELEAAKKLTAKATPLAHAEARIAELEPQVAALSTSVADLDAQLKTAPKPEPTPDYRTALALLEADLGPIEHNAKLAHAAAAVAAERLAAARGAGGRLAELEAARTKAEVELADWNRLAGDLGKDGLQAAEIDAAGPELTELVNDLLHTCHGPRFTVRVETQRLAADGKRMLEGCSVVVLDTVKGREAEGETFSGGERVIIGEALSLALSMLACRRAGFQGITLVRDESGAALDPENARVYVAMLRRAAELVRADKVLFVSHVPEVVELADARIEVGG